MHLTIKMALASLAIAALAGTASAGCYEGHAKHVTADASSSEAQTMSTHDGALPLPTTATESAEVAADQPLTGTADKAE
jgi:hypothetical protein